MATQNFILLYGFKLNLLSQIKRSFVVRSYRLWKEQIDSVADAAKNMSASVYSQVIYALWTCFVSIPKTFQVCTAKTAICNAKILS